MSNKENLYDRMRKNEFFDDEANQGFYVLESQDIRLDNMLNSGFTLQTFDENGELIIVDDNPNVSKLTDSEDPVQ